MMRFLLSLFLLLIASTATTMAFMNPLAPTYSAGSKMMFPQSRLLSSSHHFSLKMSSTENSEDHAAAMMKQQAAMMKNMKPEDIDQMIQDMDKMPAAERMQLEQMGMDPKIMKQSLELMKSNPDMVTKMADMMDNMTPEEMMEQSKKAQEQLKQSQQQQQQSFTSSQKSQAVIEEKDEQEEDDDEEEDSDNEFDIPDPDPELLDSMFRAAELMSSPPTGGVTLSAFASLGPISLLMGDNPDKDVSKAELKECWADGSLGSTRVDRAGFERVWMEVQEFFNVEIMDRARERSLERWKGTTNNKQRRGSSKPKPTAPPATTTTTTSTSTATSPRVGESISSEQLNQQVKNMSDQDLDAMLDQMSQTNVSPEQEARMKAMGVDPSMMRKTASMLKGNPLMKNAAKMMMKNMSPEQMKQASQQAQDKLSSMTPEEQQKMLQEMEQEVNKQSK